MGCCASSTTNTQHSRNSSLNSRLVKAKWKADPPLTKSQIKKQREEFWETMPYYSGKPEIWAALKLVCESDLETAKVILETSNIKVPTGSLEECYDTLGNKYVIPNFCQSDPDNIMEDRVQFMDKNIRDGAIMDVRVRTSDAKDFVIQVPENASSERLTAVLREKYNDMTMEFKFIYKGRILQPHERLDVFSIQPDTYLQVMIKK